MPEVQGWSAAQIATVGVFSAATFAALLAIVYDSLKLWQRARETADKLDNAVAELGVQHGRFTEPQQEVNRRDAFISRNLLEGSKAVAAAVLEGFSRQYQDSCPKPALNDVSIVGSNVERSNNVDDDRGNGVEPTRDVAVEPALCASAISAVRVQPGQIKTIALVSRGWDVREHELKLSMLKSANIPRRANGTEGR